MGLLLIVFICFFTQAPQSLKFLGGLAEASNPPDSESPLAGKEYVENQLIIKFAPEIGESQKKAVRTELNSVTLRKLSLIGAELVELSGLTVEEALQLLEDDPRVEYAEPNYIWHIDIIPNDPSFNLLWGMHNTGQTGGIPDADIDAPEAWNTGTGDSVIIGVIDTGVDTAHVDLLGNIWTNPGEIPNNGLDDDGNGYVDDVHGWDFVNWDNGPVDDNSHGTHVSGTIAAVGNNSIGVAGVCWSAKIMALKFLDSGGSGSTSDAILAVEYAIMMGANLTSNSWGGGPFSQALKDAIDSSGAHGMLFVAAAGNSWNNNDVSPHYPSSYDLDNIIAVAATDDRDNLADEPTWGSNYGLVSVDLGAPGVNIYSTTPGNNYGYKSGTSMATPHVSGTAALIWSEYPYLTNLQVKERIMSMAEPKANLSGMCVTGARLNAFLAIAEPDTTPPSPILDLAVAESGGSWIKLYWTATGDDSSTGTASYYDVRYSLSPIDSSNFNSATQVPGEPFPQPAGFAESLTVTGLDFNTTYYFAIKALDEWSNPSKVSNSPWGTTLGPPDISVSSDSLSDSLFTGESSIQTLTIYNTGESELYWEINTSGLGLGIVVNEIVTNDNDWIELYNGTGSTINLEGWAVFWTDTRGYSDLLYLPEFYLSPDAYVVLSELSGTNTSDHIYLGSNIMWYDGSGGSCALLDNTGNGVDFVRWGGSTQEPPSGTVWNETTPLSTPDNNHSLGRDEMSTDTDYSDDWSLGNITEAQPNQPTTLAGKSIDTEFNFSSRSGVGDPDIYSVPLETKPFNFKMLSPGPWLSTSPQSGTVPAGSYTEVEVIFDAHGLMGGDYEANLVVHSNDPDELEIEIPAFLHVTGATDIAVSEDTLDCGIVYIGYPESFSLVVSNQGTDVLTVTNLVSDLTQFSVDLTNFVLAPGEDTVVNVTFSPTSVGVLWGNLTISSDDPDQPNLVVTLRGEGLICPDLWVDPSSVSQSLYTGESSVESLTVGNSGGSALYLQVELDNFVGSSLMKSVGSGKVAVSHQGSFSITELLGPRQEKKLSFDPDAKTTEGLYNSNQDGFSNLPASPGDILASWLAPSPIQLAWGLGFDGSEVWVSDPNGITDNEVSTTGVLLSWFSCTSWAGSWPGDMAWDGSYIWQVNVGGDNGIYQLNPATGAVLNTIHDPSHTWDATSQRGLAYDKKTDVFYIGGWNQNRVYKIKGLGWGNPGEIISYFDFPNVSGLAWHPGGTLWIAVNASTDYIFQVDPETGSIISKFLAPGTGAGYEGSGLAIDKSGNLWCVSQGTNMVYLVESGVPAYTWLVISPEACTLGVGETKKFALWFDATGLEGGDYSADILIHSNDCDQPTLTVPAMLHVTGAPDIVLDSDSLDYGIVFISASVTDTLMVSNEGTDVLTVSDISSDNSDYGVNITSFSLNPGQKQMVLVSFTPSSTGLITGTLTISSNDPDEPSYMVYLKGVGAEPPDISVSPDSLSDSLFTDETSIHILTIYNTGVSDLVFDIETEMVITGGQPKMSNNVISLQESDIQSIFKVNAQIQVDQGRNSNDNSFEEMEAPSIKGKAVLNSKNLLIFRDNLAWGYDVNVPILQGLGANVTTATSSQMGSIDLSPYDVILFESQQPTSFYNTYISNLSKFESFLNSGGVIEFHCATYTSSRVPNLPFPGGMQTLSSADLDYDNYIADPTHPIVAGAYDPLQGNYASHEAFQNLPLNANVIVENESGLPTTVEYTYGTGTLIATGMTWEIGYASGWNSGDPLLPNALEYSLSVGLNWLSVTPTSGTIPSGSSVDIEVKFDATGMYGGDYYSNVLISNNDPDEPLVTVPAYLHVTGLPDIALNFDSLDYGNVFIGASVTDTLVVSNEGTDILTVTDISSDNSNYSVDITSFALNPGESQKVVITFAPNIIGVISGNLTITSDDPDEPSLTVHLQGQGLIPPDISVFPDSLYEYLVTDEMKAETLAINNTGGSDLTFEILIEEAGSTSVVVNYFALDPVRTEKVVAVGTPVPLEEIESKKPPFLRKTIMGPTDLIDKGMPFQKAEMSYKPLEMVLGEEVFGNKDYAYLGGPRTRGNLFTCTTPTTLVEHRLYINPSTSTQLWFLVYEGSAQVGTYNLISASNVSPAGPGEGWYSSGEVDVNLVAGKYYLIVASFEQQSYYYNQQNISPYPIPASFGELTAGAGWNWAPTAVFPPDPTQSVPAGAFGDPVAYYQTLVTRAGVAWLQADPLSGTVPKDTSFEVILTFDATDMAVGDYDADLIINSNDPDESELRLPAHLRVILRGDANADFKIDISDVVNLIKYVLDNGLEPKSLSASDVNCDGNVVIDDIIYLINYLYRGGPAIGDPDNDGIPDC
jgi:subtilisin family serine protease